MSYSINDNGGVPVGLYFEGIRVIPKTPFSFGYRRVFVKTKTKNDQIEFTVSSCENHEIFVSNKPSMIIYKSSG